MAYVRLGRGRTAYFDPITRVHLTLANPEAGVPDHLDLSGLRRAHKNGVIVLVETAASKPNEPSEEPAVENPQSAEADGLAEQVENELGDKAAEAQDSTAFEQAEPDQKPESDESNSAEEQDAEAQASESQDPDKSGSRRKKRK